MWGSRASYDTTLAVSRKECCLNYQRKQSQSMFVFYTFEITTSHKGIMGLMGLPVLPEDRISGNIAHYCDVIMGENAPQITSTAIAYSTVYLGTDQRKHQSSTSLAFVRGIHRWPMLYSTILNYFRNVFISRSQRTSFLLTLCTMGVKGHYSRTAGVIKRSDTSLPIPGIWNWFTM